MVVHAVSAAARGVVHRRELAHVAPVVVAEQQGHVVRNPHPFVVVVLYLFIQRPYLRGLRGGLAGDIGYHPALVADYPLEQRDVGAFLHSHVAVAPHSYRHHVLGVLHPLDSAPPEVHQNAPVLVIVPGAAAVAVPFLLGPGAGLVVRRAHDYAHLVGIVHVERVVVVECGVPHRRPHEVALQAQQQFEHPAVEAALVAVGVLVDPAGEGRCLVIEEDTSVIYLGLSLGIAAVEDVYPVPVYGRDVGPPVPGRHAYRGAQSVDAVGGAALVASGDYHLAVTRGLEYVLLPCALQGCEILGREIVFDESSAAYGAYDYSRSGRPAGNGCTASGHSREVFGEVLHCPFDALPFVPAVHGERGYLLPVCDERAGVSVLEDCEFGGVRT